MGYLVLKDQRKQLILCNVLRCDYFAVSLNCAAGFFRIVLTENSRNGSHLINRRCEWTITYWSPVEYVSYFFIWPEASKNIFRLYRCHWSVILHTSTNNCGIMSRLRDPHSLLWCKFNKILWVHWEHFNTQKISYLSKCTINSEKMLKWNLVQLCHVGVLDFRNSKFKRVVSRRKPV